MTNLKAKIAVLAISTIFWLTGAHAQLAPSADSAFDGTNIWASNEGGNTVTKLLASTGAVWARTPLAAAR